MTATSENVSIVIPAYNPDKKLVELVNELSAYSFKEIIIVNDGSDKQFKPIFDKVRFFTSCTLLTHPENLGKGQALKTAFSYYVENYQEGIGVVTADADGQHRPEDIKKIAQELVNKPANLILGARDFSKENIPARSRFGNILTQKATKLVSGLNVTDTQTGLRGIPREFAKQLLNVNGKRYEFEMKMILACKTYNRNISEFSIDTIYIDENESSHFNPIIDSIKIYYVFGKFLISSLLSFIVDIALFALFVFIFKAFMPVGFILLATVLARLLSSLFNFVINRKVVFKSYNNVKKRLVMYGALALILMAASAFGVHTVYHAIGSHEVLIKIVIDSILFLLSFYIQRNWVFNQSEVKVKKEVNYE
ncbi:bifunctional glycosyltransferase family 2/GtrA family protein [Bacillus solitudinis]|uniref:bifunctional glycosyltransferase family 2/GtrA family protein n=1 Tax=Bacillus solitudinis TaxID=2014074 RepID=UPI000C23ED08|nr:bifunctional glycosyltransferase family 2/GtrA family protein [Bacillus solitudinis]